MTDLKFEKHSFLSADMGGLSSLPPISVKLSLSDITNKFSIDEDDGLFVNYGIEESVYPYREQNLYDRDLKPTEYESAVLENEYLKATFMPCFGGKLWSLIDKTTGKELLFKNDVVRPCNLGVRNAWLSGGIEWNSCFKGHNPFTCSLINTATTALADGTPVLRFYYFERIRAAVVQMDIFLPDGSKLLYIRTRITNPNEKVIPMYWWSNVAAVEKKGDRVIVPAKMSYTVNSDCDVIKIDVPVYNGIDVTYPAGNITSNDFFWTVKDAKRYYIAQLDKDGYGLIQTSTSRLKGRKLFVWGNSQGGHKWMNFLTADDKSGRYDEIQSGLAPTQYESLPMPPHTVWEWVECYGAMQADKEKIHGDYSVAQKETENKLNEMSTADNLEKLLIETRTMAKSPAKVLYFSDGWGALELERRKRKGENLMSDHLDFGNLGVEQKSWLNLLDGGSIGLFSVEDVPLSYMRQKEWIDMLLSAVNDNDKDNWYSYYLLGTYYIAEENFGKAREFLEKSIEKEDSAWANYAMSVLSAKEKDKNAEIEYILKAYEMRKADVCIAKELFRKLYEHSLSEKTVCLYKNATENIKANKRCLLYYAYALARLGRLDEAEEILCGKDGKTYLVVPDVRECELTVTQLWVYIHEQRGETREQMGEPPYDLDFRMFSKREGWI